MHIAIDTKNLALYSGGIASFARPLIAAWLAHRPDLSFSLVGPPFESSEFSAYRNWRHVDIAWPKGWPRMLRHPLYDLLLFPRVIGKLKPQFLFSFYHDVRLPARARGIRSVMMIHDTCLLDCPSLYPIRIRAYYLTMLQLNLRRACHVLTVSEASRARIVDCYRVPPERLDVIYNSIDGQFGKSASSQDLVGEIRRRHSGAKLVLYPGGSERRKNAARLVEAVGRLVASGTNVRLLVTGRQDDEWTRVLSGPRATMIKHVDFLGLLGPGDLRASYQSVDAIAYPTLCEGFGRVCLEAMASGTPLACSDLPVLHEVGGDYPHYFDPLTVPSIADVLAETLATPRPRSRRDPRFESERVAASFTGLMDRLIAIGER